MMQVTIRKVEEAWVEKAKAEAKARGVSMNRVLVEALAKGLGVRETKPTNGLERLAGSCPDDFGADWEDRMRIFEQIDEDLWK